MPELIIIRGYPGSGKTTLGRYLQNQNSGIFVDHHIILNAVSKIVPDDAGLTSAISYLELSITGKMLKDNKNVIIARGFNSTHQVEPYIKLAKSKQAAVLIFHLEVPVAELSRRVVATERANNTMAITKPSDLKAWIKDHPFDNIDGEIALDGLQPIKEIAKAISKSITRDKHRFPSTGRA